MLDVGCWMLDDELWMIVQKTEIIVKLTKIEFYILYYDNYLFSSVLLKMSGMPNEDMMRLLEENREPLVVIPFTVLDALLASSSEIHGPVAITVGMITTYVCCKKGCKRTSYTNKLSCCP